MKKLFSKEILRFIISFILASLVCLGLFLTAILSDVLIFSKPSFILSCAEKSNYTEYAVPQITEELNELAIPSGLPEDFFTGKIDKAAFSKLYYSCTENLAAGNKDYKLDVDAFKSDVYNRVAEYSKNEGGELTSEVEKDIELFSQECSKIYLSYVNPSLTSYLFDLLNTVDKYLLTALIITTIFTISVGIFLFKVNRISSFLKFSFASLLGAALTLGVIPAYLIITKEISKISISSKSLFAITTTFAEQFLWLMIISAVILAIVAIILLIIKIFILIFRR